MFASFRAEEGGVRAIQLGIQSASDVIAKIAEISLGRSNESISHQEVFIVQDPDEEKQKLLGTKTYSIPDSYAFECTDSQS